MPEMLVPDDFIEDEPGLWEADGRASAFFYYRTCDQASDVFLDAVDLGATARREIDQSTYSAAAELTVEKPVRKGEALVFAVRVLRIGGKSMTYAVEVLGAEDRARRAVYTSVGVCMDMTGPRPKPIPDSVREKLEAYA